MTVDSQNITDGSLIFSEIASHHLVQLTNTSVRRKFSKGKHLFHEGEMANSFYQLLSGKVCMYRLSPEGEEKVFQTLHGGDTLAESAMLMSPNLYPLSARVEKSCEVQVYSRHALLDLCKENPEFSLQLLSALSTRLNQNINRIDQLTLKSAGQRLVAYLIEQYQLQHSEWLTLPVAHGTLAGQLNIAPETLSRLFQRLRQAEVISGKRQTVVLLDIKAMCELVNLPYIESIMSSGHIGIENTVSMAGCCNLRPRALIN